MLHCVQSVSDRWLKWFFSCVVDEGWVLVWRLAGGWRCLAGWLGGGVCWFLVCSYSVLINGCRCVQVSVLQVTSQVCVLALPWCGVCFHTQAHVTSDSERVKDLDLDTRGRSKPEEQD